MNVHHFVSLVQPCTYIIYLGWACLARQTTSEQTPYSGLCTAVMAANKQSGWWYLVNSQISVYGAIQVLRNAFIQRIWPHPPPSNANNVDPYTFVTLFSGKADTPHPMVIHNTWMAPKTHRHNGMLSSRHSHKYVVENTVLLSKKRTSWYQQNVHNTFTQEKLLNFQAANYRYLKMNRKSSIQLFSISVLCVCAQYNQILWPDLTESLWTLRGNAITMIRTQGW